MKKQLFYLAFATLFIFSCGGNTEKKEKETPVKEETKKEVVEKKEDPNTFKDSRDGKTYKTVKIGDQVWLAENLAFKMEKGCWAYKNEEESAKKFGYMYDWNSAVKAAPAGWHLPSKEEFETLLKNTGANHEESYKALIEGGSSKFEAILAGWYSPGDSPFVGPDGTYFWSATEYSQAKYAYNLGVSPYDPKKAGVGSIEKTQGYYIRLVKD